MQIYNQEAPKKEANLSINSDLLHQARGCGINLSKALEERLVEMLMTLKKQKWLDENQEAIEKYNHRIEAEGAFGDDLRSF